MRTELNLDATDTLKISIEHYDFKQRTKTKAYYSDCHVNGLCRFNNVLNTKSNHESDNNLVSAYYVVAKNILFLTVVGSGIVLITTAYNNCIVVLGY